MGSGPHFRPGFLKPRVQSSYHTSQHSSQRVSDLRQRQARGHYLTAGHTSLDAKCTTSCQCARAVPNRAKIIYSSPGDAKSIVPNDQASNQVQNQLQCAYPCSQPWNTASRKLAVAAPLQRAPKQRLENLRDRSQLPQHRRQPRPNGKGTVRAR